MLLCLKFLCVQRFISLFLIALRTQFHHRFLVLLFYLRFNQIGSKLQQPFRNQSSRIQNVNIASNIFDHVKVSLCMVVEKKFTNPICMVVFFLLFNSLVVKVLDSQSRGPVFKITGWLQG